MSASDFNLDAVDDSGYKPVTVTYREKEYSLGASAYGLMMAPGLLDLKGKSTIEVGAELIKALPELLDFLCPELAKVLEEPTFPEQMMLIQAMTEVLNRLGRFRVTSAA